MVEHLAEKGWRITVACTLFDAEKSTAMRPAYMQWTHDIFFLPDFLQTTEFPAFLRYLISSRHIRNVLMTNCQLAYELLPYLQKHSHPSTRFVDLVHAEQMDFKEGGYPWVSTIFSEHLSRTIAISHHVEEFMVARGKRPEQIGVIQPGVNTTFWQRPPSSPANGNPEGPLRLAMVARMDEGKRPIMAIRATAAAIKAGAQVTLTIIGGGQLQSACEGIVASLGLGSSITIAGQRKAPETREILGAADVFFLPTAHEGISVAVLEGMSM